MNFTDVERVILANQYMILKALYPKNAQHYEEAYQAIVRGYEIHYTPEEMCIGDSVMTIGESNEVIEILNMYRAIVFSYNSLQDRTGIDARRIAFPGFDANDEIEGKYMCYAEFVCSHDGGRFNEIDRGGGLNSHCPMLDRYRAMIECWRAMEQPTQLTAEQIQELISI